MSACHVALSFPHKVVEFILHIHMLSGNNNPFFPFQLGFAARITTSKSDSCLYGGELSMSSDGAMAISQEDPEQSFSEGDLVSSSDLSELRNEPLFSPEVLGSHDHFNISNATYQYILSRAREAWSPLNPSPERRQGTPLDPLAC